MENKDYCDQQKEFKLAQQAQGAASCNGERQRFSQTSDKWAALGARSSQATVSKWSPWTPCSERGHVALGCTSQGYGHGRAQASTDSRSWAPPECRNTQMEEGDSVYRVKGIRAKNWIPQSCSQMESEEIIQHFTSMDLTMICKLPLTHHSAGMFTCRSSFLTKFRGKESAVGGTEQITGRAQETKRQFSSVVTRCWHILPFITIPWGRTQLTVSLEKKLEGFPVPLLSWDKQMPRAGRCNLHQAVARCS